MTTRNSKHTCKKFMCMKDVERNVLLCFTIQGLVQGLDEC